MNHKERKKNMKMIKNGEKEKKMENYRVRVDGGKRIFFHPFTWTR